MKRANSQIHKAPTQIIELTIDSLSYHGGRGVGRFEGVVVFVPGTAPQERVRARVTVKKSRLWEAELVEVLEASPFRRVPPCSLAERCGGCAWQHIEYAQQVEQKRLILEQSLRALKKYGEWTWLPFLPAPQEFHYRNRIQVHQKNGRFGFFAKRSRDLVEVDYCRIAEHALNESLATLQKSSEERIEIAALESGEVRLMEGSRDPEAALFSQVNSAQNQVLKQKVIELCSGVEPRWVMDLYAGAGNLTKPLADRFPGVALHAVELSRASVQRGRELLPEVNWHAGDVAQVLTGLSRLSPQGLVVLDPPRTGVAPQVLEEMLRHAPQQIVYVSCNPTTFARDVQRLLEKGSYRLVNVQGLDMFPQTEHVELMALLCAAT